MKRVIIKVMSVLPLVSQTAAAFKQSKEKD